MYLIFCFMAQSLQFFVIALIWKTELTLKLRSDQHETSLYYMLTLSSKMLVRIF